MLEVEDTIVLENAAAPWTSQRFCATTAELIAAGSGAIAGLILVAVVLILVTWKCTKCLGTSGSNEDQNSTRTASELGNGR